MFTVTASDRSNSSSASSAHTATPPPPPLMALPPSVTSLEVIDPCNRTGKIRVPMTHVAETAGIVDFHLAPERRQGKELSLCLLFQKGRCNAGARCHQVHAAPEYVAQLREQAASTRNCCADHGDMHSSGSFAAFIAETVAVVDASTGSVGRFAIGAFARTACLDAVLRGARRGVEPRVPAAKVCRLHAQGRCKFGKDCRNIHLCPAAVPLAGSTSGAAAVVAAPSAAFFLPTPPAALLPTATGGPKPFPAPIGALSVSSSEHGGSSSCGGSTPSDTPRMQPAARRFGAPIIAPPTPVTLHVAPPAPIGSAADSTVAAASLPLLPPPTTAKPLSLWSCEGFGLLAAAGDAHNSGFFGSERSSTAADAAAALRRKQEDEEIAGLDMSAFEATLKSLCDDLARADFSPAAAQRSNPLFAA